jgi:hypothetical protein
MAAKDNTGRYAGPDLCGYSRLVDSSDINGSLSE